MINKSQEIYTKNEDQLRKELYNLIEHEKLSSAIVQKLSKELDEMILMYYRQPNFIQDFIDP